MKKSEKGEWEYGGAIWLQKKDEMRVVIINSETMEMRMATSSGKAHLRILAAILPDQWMLELAVDISEKNQSDWHHQVSPVTTEELRRMFGLDKGPYKMPDFFKEEAVLAVSVFARGKMRRVAGIRFSPDLTALVEELFRWRRQREEEGNSLAENEEVGNAETFARGEIAGAALDPKVLKKALADCRLRKA